ncbi:MAG: isocitrate/isopropylmalate family dehydrogenase, partial [Rhodothermales bacterium]|nr:isocitrate/isopropylmalate family dehydrogenase [Rhodothermales bacterium]
MSAPTAAPRFEHLTPPSAGEPIRKDGDRLHVPDRPVIPFIEGDGTGPDIWAAAHRVLEAAVDKAYGGAMEIVWFEVYAGEKANDRFGS